MATKKPSRPMAKPRRRSAFRIVFAVVLIVALAAAVTIVVLHDRHQKAIAADQARFAQAEKSFIKLGNFINSNTSPLQTSQDKYCRYSGHEFAESQLICELSYSAFYQVAPLTQANVLSSKYDQYINSSQSGLRFIKVIEYPRNNDPSQSSFGIFQLNDKEETRKELYDINISNFSCMTTHELYDAANTPIDLKRIGGDGYVLASTVMCSSIALQPYYKLEN